jgi:hypothetical protein
MERRKLTARTKLTKKRFTAEAQRRQKRRINGNGKKITGMRVHRRVCGESLLFLSYKIFFSAPSVPPR